jgi:hypothetical protein
LLSFPSIESNFFGICVNLPLACPVILDSFICRKIFLNV